MPYGTSLLPDPEADTRTRILDATLRLLSESGEAALRVSTVAERAGLSTGAIYGLFASRESLIASAYVERIHNWTVEATTRGASPAAVEDTHTNGDAALRAAVADLTTGEGREVRLAWADAAARAQFDPLLRTALRPTERAYLEYTATEVRKMQEAGLIRADVDPRAVAAVRSAIGIGVALVSRVYDDDPTFFEELITAWPLIFAAFAPPGSPE